MVVVAKFYTMEEYSLADMTYEIKLTPKNGLYSGEPIIITRDTQAEAHRELELRGFVVARY